MGEDLSKHEIKDHVKRRKREREGRTIGVDLLNGDRIVGILEESRPNILMVRDRADNLLKDIHRALVIRFMFIIDGGNDVS
jgi:hypothetical protein